MPLNSREYELPRVALVAPVRATSSGSGTFLGLASDGKQYWVKAPGNPQGIRTLVAEVVVHGVGILLGAPVRPTALIDIPRDMNWTYAPSHRLSGGVGHASLNLESAIVSDDWDTYTALDHNRERQALVFALWDLCMGGDPQWLHDVLGDYALWTFDHGFWLGGEGDWSPDSLRRVGVRPWQYDLSPERLSAGGLRAAAVAVEGLERASILKIAQSVPLDWQISEDELRVLADVIYLRAEGVAQRLFDAANQANFD